MLYRLEVKQQPYQHATRVFQGEYIDEPQFMWLMASSLDKRLLEEFGHLDPDRQWFLYKIDFSPWWAGSE